MPIVWGNVLPMLADNNYHVEYLESREKYTADLSKLPKGAKITKQRMIQDCEDAVELLGLNRYVAIGSSLGSTILVDAMLYSKVNPQHTILINVLELARFDFRRLFAPVINHYTYNRIAKPKMKQDMRKTYLNIEQDPEQYEKYALALDFADTGRARRALNAWYGNKTWDHLSELENECTIVIWEEKLHQSPRAEKIVAEHKNLDLVVMESHKEAHDKPLVDLIESLIHPS